MVVEQIEQIENVFSAVFVGFLCLVFLSLLRPECLQCCFGCEAGWVRTDTVEEG